MQRNRLANSSESEVLGFYTKLRHMYEQAHSLKIWSLEHSFDSESSNTFAHREKGACVGMGYVYPSSYICL